ncbi:MAG: hypothetical protein FJX61_02380 [Alphaproteobacteria bacterium]|nr:hypothetical protein [Alphaproteobacteria bacterium]
MRKGPGSVAVAASAILRGVRAAVAGAALAIVAGCELPQGLREEYMFKDWLEPSRAPRIVKHDPYGNAVVPPEERRAR